MRRPGTVGTAGFRSRHAALPDRPGIEPFDTAGLLDATRRSWYPVLPDDLLGSRSKLEATADEVRRLLERCGFVSA